jgi:heme exporter protein D
MILPLAHLGHYLWLMYIPPVLIVLGSIVKTMLSQRREERQAERDERKKG